MRKIILLILSINFMFATTNSISIQGVLRDNYNRAVDDGMYNMSFIIYSAESGGSVLWSSLANNNNLDYEVQVINGVYSYALPVNTDIQNGSSQLWLEVTVNNSTMTNRVKINLTPYEYYNVTGGTNQVPESGNVYFGAYVEVAGTLEASTTNFHNSISSDDIGNDAVGSNEIAANAVGASEIAANAVGASEITANAVGASEIATDAVDSAEIKADAVGSSELQAGAGAYSDFEVKCTGSECYSMALSGATATGSNIESSPRIITFDCPDEGALYIVNFLTNSSSGYYAQLEVHTTNASGSSFIEVGGEFSDEWTNNTMLERHSVTSPCLPGGQFRIKAKYLNFSDSRTSIIEWTY